MRLETTLSINPTDVILNTSTVPNSHIRENELDMLLTLLEEEDGVVLNVSGNFQNKINAVTTAGYIIVL